jgi:hypothetical protein
LDEDEDIVRFICIGTEVNDSFLGLLASVELRLEVELNFSFALLT